MVCKIHRLCDQTINQIAAGEVIENPASVVKELIENAIDAGAKNICIAILGGGFQSICISDDGNGMNEEEAILSIERHATSKILSSDDLFSLQTMGFRGEALASIASISKMTITSASREEDPIQIQIEGGKITQKGPFARARGTTIEVLSLFYNVPARKKFQKSPSRSLAEITKVVISISLGQPHIGFELIQQGKTQLSLLPLSSVDFLTALKTRARNVLEEEFIESALPIEVEEDQVKIRGFISHPLISRPNRSLQFLFVNQRPVFSPLISYVIKEAYGTRLATDRFPLFLLHLEIDPSCVDVNVHPQKKEVRFKEESFLKFLLQSKIRQTLSSQEGGQESPQFSVPPAFSPYVFEERPHLIKPFSFCESDALVANEEQPSLPLCMDIKIIGLYSPYLLVDASSISEDLQGIYFFDLTAIESCLWFEKLIHPSLSSASQQLLLPLTLAFSKSDTPFLLQELSHLEELGIFLHQIGESAFSLDAIPPFMKEEEVSDFLRNWILEHEHLEKKRMINEKKRKQMAVALLRSIRQKKRNYSLEEAKELVFDVLKMQSPFLCPQGKPLFYHMRENEIETRFRAPSSLSS